MKVAVTGSHGFIGRVLVERLKSMGHEVDCWDLVIDKDMADFQWDGHQMMYHLGGLVNVRESIYDPDRYWVENVLMSRQVFEECERYGCKVIYATSCCSKQFWLSPYGASMRGREAVAPWSSTGYRMTTVYGEEASDSSFVGLLMDDQLEYVTSHTRDFIHVDDVVDMFTAENQVAGIYDLGYGESYEIEDLARLAGYDVPLVVGDASEMQDNSVDCSTKNKKSIVDFITSIRNAKKEIKN